MRGEIVMEICPISITAKRGSGRALTGSRWRGRVAPDERDASRAELRGCERADAHAAHGKRLGTQEDQE